jgi:hypothetical protein
MNLDMISDSMAAKLITLLMAVRYFGQWDPRIMRRIFGASCEIGQPIYQKTQTPSCVSTAIQAAGTVVGGHKSQDLISFLTSLAIKEVRPGQNFTSHTNSLLS